MELTDNQQNAINEFLNLLMDEVFVHDPNNEEQWNAMVAGLIIGAATDIKAKFPNVVDKSTLIKVVEIADSVRPGTFNRVTESVKDMTPNKDWTF